MAYRKCISGREGCKRGLNGGRVRSEAQTEDAGRDSAADGRWRGRAVDNGNQAAVIVVAVVMGVWVGGRREKSAGDEGRGSEQSEGNKKRAAESTNQRRVLSVLFRVTPSIRVSSPTISKPGPSSVAHDSRCIARLMAKEGCGWSNEGLGGRCDPSCRHVTTSLLHRRQRRAVRGCGRPWKTRKQACLD